MFQPGTIREQEVLVETDEEIEEGDGVLEVLELLEPRIVQIVNT